MKDEVVIENAVINSVMLGYEGHGIFTCWLMLSGDGWGIGFGGYALDTYDNTQNKRVGTVYGMNYIIELLKTFEVETIDELKNKPLRVVFDGDKFSSSIIKIGHFMKDNWFDPKQISKY